MSVLPSTAPSGEAAALGLSVRASVDCEVGTADLCANMIANLKSLREVPAALL